MVSFSYIPQINGAIRVFFLRLEEWLFHYKTIYSNHGSITVHSSLLTWSLNGLGILMRIGTLGIYGVAHGRLLNGT